MFQSLYYGADVLLKMLKWAHTGTGTLGSVHTCTSTHFASGSLAMFPYGVQWLLHHPILAKFDHNDTVTFSGGISNPYPSVMGIW